MSGKEFWKELLQDYFVVVTFINLAMFVLGMMYMREQRFGYEAMLMPLIYSALSMIPTAVMYSKKELSMKEICIRKAIQVVLIEIILYLAVYGVHNIMTNDIVITVSFGISILIVYVLANGISYLLNRREAQKLTDGLRRFQEEYEKS